MPGVDENAALGDILDDHLLRCGFLITRELDLSVCTLAHLLEDVEVFDLLPLDDRAANLDQIGRWVFIDLMFSTSG